MASLEGRVEDRQRAVDLLDYVFTSALFDGKFLAHDRAEGHTSGEHCSGCNFHALFLVDRLYGDSWRVAKIPDVRDLPVREPRAPEVQAPPSILTGAWNSTNSEGSPLALGIGMGSWLELNFRFVEPAGDRPRGAIRLELKLTLATEGAPIVVERRGDVALLLPIEEQGLAGMDLGSGPPESRPRDVRTSHGIQATE
jgi:hypothetical protein